MSTLAATATAPIVDDESLVFHVNLLFVALIAVFALTRLPRAFALFGTSSEWYNGHILRHVSHRPPPRRFALQNAYPPAPIFKERVYGSSDDNHGLYYQQAQRLTEKGTPAAMHFPPHVPACITALRPLLTPLRARCAPGFSVAQVIVLATYFYSLVYASFYKSNVFTDSTRTGWISVAQLPFVFAMSQKNNVLGSILGYGYEKLNFLHRFAGRLVVLAANIHSLHYIYKWTLAGTFTTQVKTPSTTWALVALVCLDMIFFFSTEYWRQKAYNIFLSTHIVGFILVLPALYLHKPSMLPYILGALGLFLFDHLLRLIKSRFTTAFLRPLPELDLTRVEIRSLNAGWRAGQHVRLRVLSAGMGWTGWAEVHPFTIASVAKAEDGMVLMCKRAGGWTRKLYEMAKMGGYTEGGVGREVKVVVEGPYGGPQHTIFSSFSAAVFVAGGSGITYALSAIQDLVQKDLAGESRVKVIELVWIVPDPACLAPLLPTLASLIQSSAFTPLRISVFYTRAPTGKQPAFFSAASAGPFIGASPVSVPPPVDAGPSPTAPHAPKRPQALILTGKDASPSAALYRSPTSRSTPPLNVNVKRSGSGSKDPKMAGAPSPISPATSQQPHFPPGLTLSPGKPRLLKFIEHALQRAVTLGRSSRHNRAKDEQLRLSGLVIGVCGPVGLADDVTAAVAGVEAVRRDQVGGVEVCEEVFGW